MTTKKDSESVINADWLSDLDMDNVDKSAEMDILPEIKITLNNPITVVVNSLPILTEFQGKEAGKKYYIMTVKQNEVIYQINCHAKSFRFQLAVLSKKLGGMDKIIGKVVQITKSKVKMKNYPNAELYSIILIN